MPTSGLDQWSWPGDGVISTSVRVQRAACRCGWLTTLWLEFICRVAALTVGVGRLIKLK